VKKSITTVKQRLHNKFVLSGIWTNMSDTERVDAAHAESMIYAQQQPSHKVYSVEESQTYRRELRERLTAAIANK